MEGEAIRHTYDYIPAYLKTTVYQSMSSTSSHTHHILNSSTMFRPSTSLMFKPIPALNKWIHHPMIPTQRESAQLLNLLTDSFRQQLDAEHPAFQKPDNASPPSRTNTKPRRHSFSDSQRHPADRHMHSVLSNPLFSISPNTHHHNKDPMTVFDMAVAKGMMNINHAKACLQAKKAKIIRSPTLSVRDGMQESGAGLNVLRWLITSGISVDNQFLTDQVFATLLMEFMVAEGLQEHAWNWIKRSFRNASAVAALPMGSPWQSARRDLAGPLRALVCAELQHNATLDAAYMCMSRAAGYLNGASSLTMTTALQPAGMLLIKETCMLNVSHPPPSETSFESFVSLVPIITRNRTDHYLAHLSLLHPTKPDATLAYELLRYGTYGQTVKSWEFVPARKRSTVIQLGLDTAKVLLDEKRYTDMEWVMKFLSENFPDQIGIVQTRQLEQVKAEASSIELLSSIGIA